MITIRTATISDLEIIQKLSNELFEYERKNWDPNLETGWPFSEQGKLAYEKAIKEKCVLIAEDHGNPIGYLIGSVKHPGTDAARRIITAQLDNIFVVSDARRKNVGKRLYECFSDYCIENNATAVNVMVNAKNIDAIRFYENTGFAPSRLLLIKELRK